MGFVGAVADTIIPVSPLPPVSPLSDREKENSLVNVFPSTDIVIDMLPFLAVSAVVAENVILQVVVPFPVTAAVRPVNPVAMLVALPDTAVLPILVIVACTCAVFL